MATSQFIEKLARNMVAEQGTAIIWQLHIDAATLYQNGNQTAAATFLEIADAAEREWFRGRGEAEVYRGDHRCHVFTYDRLAP
jgi:hypothetical protein